MSSTSSEAQPLLAGANSAASHGTFRARSNSADRLGPLEIPKSTRYGILAGIWSATFLSALNQTLVPTMIPSISSEFNKFNQASWLGTAYLLSTCTFSPLYGRLCNVLGRKGANHLALAFTGLGVLGCGLSTSMEMLIFFRFLSGIGGGGLQTTSSIIVSDMYSMRDRGLAQGMASVFNGMAMGLGGPFGGLVTDWLGWRWAFIIQTPAFVISFLTTSYFLQYVTPGKGRSTKEVLKRIDYGGSIILLITVGSALLFLSARYNEGLPWSNPAVIASLTIACVGFVGFVFVELFVSPEPVLAPSLLKRKIPVLVGLSNFLVATCNFTIIYNFPMWFQIVQKKSASIAGLHLMPNSVALSLGSVFAGYMMHLTGKYKMINMTFGWFPFIGATLIASLNKDSSPLLTWLAIIPLGFGNAIVLQTMLIALLVRLAPSQMAVGTGFGQLWRGVGQVGGVAVSSAVFQSKLDTELRKYINGPGAEDLIRKIRHSSSVVSSLPKHIEKIARDSYAISLKTVFIYAAVSTMLAFLVRLPIPDKDLDQARPEDDDLSETLASTPAATTNEASTAISPAPKPRKRRLSVYEPTDAVRDLEAATPSASGTSTPAPRYQEGTAS